jgi:threonine dehydratase
VTGTAGKPPGTSLALPTVADARAARDALRGRVVRTPVLRSEALDLLIGGPAAAKAEGLQHTGSFKLRGALNRVRTLSRDALDAGLITVSAGNAALGAARAAREFGAKLTVVMPENAVPEKLRAVRAHGATVVCDGITNATLAFEAAEALLAEHGYTFLHPFDDPMVIAGAATATIEFLEDEPGLARMLVPCSGGGMIAGAILGARAMGSQVEIIGVQPEGADGIVRSLAAGTPTPPPAIATIADGLTAPKPGRLNLELIRSARIRVVTVSDEMILAALGHIVRALRVVVEPSAAVGLAALLGQPSLAGPGTTGLILSGSNVSMGLLAQVLGQLPGHRPVLAEERAVERRSAPVDRRVKALALTPEGERLRACFRRELVEDPGPLAPLGNRRCGPYAERFSPWIPARRPGAASRHSAGSLAPHDPGGVRGGAVPDTPRLLPGQPGADQERG